MLIPVVACILGIVVENWYWPQDRAEARERFVESGRPGEKLSLLAGLVLGHSVVRWLLAFAVAGLFVRAALEAPGAREWMRVSVDSGALSLDALDALLGLAVSALMALLALGARLAAR